MKTKQMVEVPAEQFTQLAKLAVEVLAVERSLSEESVAEWSEVRIDVALWDRMVKLAKRARGGE